MVTPVSRPFELVIAASKQLPCGVWPEVAFFFGRSGETCEHFSLAGDAKNQRIRQCAHWLMHRPPACAITHSSLATVQKRRPPDGGLLFWSEWRDLNSRPHGPEPCALPAALHPEKPIHYNDCPAKCQEKSCEAAQLPFERTGTDFEKSGFPSRIAHFFLRGSYDPYCQGNVFMLM